MYTLEHEEQVGGFTIKLYTTPETEKPDWDLTPLELEELCNKINSGEYLYFTAKVTAEKEDIELASDYLGGCCYESIQEFINDPYYTDMKNTVLKEAKETINKLCEGNQ